MHSRIFQVSRQKIEKDEYYDAERYYSGEHEGFAGDYSEVADYVDEDTDRISDIKWLSQYHLEQSYSEKFGFYIDEYNQKNYYTDFFGPLDDFMRRVQDGEVYYIGATIDYHC